VLCPILVIGIVVAQKEIKSLVDKYCGATEPLYRELSHHRNVLERFLGAGSHAYMRNPWQLQCFLCAADDKVVLMQRPNNLNEWRKHVKTMHKESLKTVCDTLGKAMRSRELSEVHRLQVDGKDFQPACKPTRNIKDTVHWIDTGAPKSVAVAVSPADASVMSDRDDGNSLSQTQPNP
jgi:hypothetical protein